MTALRPALAVIGAAMLAVALSPAASAQEARPALVRFVAPTPNSEQVLTVGNATIHAFVSSVPGVTLSLTVTRSPNVIVTKKEITPTSMCQEVNESVALSHNGSYQVTVTTTETPASASPAADECRDGNKESRQFFVAAPPRPPSDVKAALDPARAVTVSWAKNPEPDIVSYRVERSAGTGAFQQVGEVEGTSFKDGAVPPAGPLRYRLLAVREGKTPDPRDVVVSAPSVAVTVGAVALAGALGRRVPTPDHKPFTVGPSAPQPGAGAAASEGGFDERLPYQPGEEAELTELGTNETSNNVHRSMGFVAGGLLAFVTFMLLRTIRAEVDRQPLAG